MIRRPPRSTLSSSSAASDVYKRQPQDVQQINKRAVHRQMEMMGIRSALRAGTELQQLSMHTKSARDFFKMVAEEGLTNALSDRDTKYGDYRETNDKKGTRK